MEDLIVGSRYIFYQLPTLGEAALITLHATILGIALAFVGGLALTVPRMSSLKIASWPASIYIAVMRYTPLLIQIYLLYFGLPIVGIRLSNFTCGVLALMLQHSAFLAEIFRAAVAAVPDGQWAAGRSIGLRRHQIAIHVILPQAIYRAMAPLGNEMVLLSKDTSLLAAIGVAEMTLSAKIIAERSGATISVFIAIGCGYLVLTTFLGIGARFLERLMKKE